MTRSDGTTGDGRRDTVSDRDSGVSGCRKSQDDTCPEKGTQRFVSGCRLVCGFTQCPVSVRLSRTGVGVGDTRCLVFCPEVTGSGRPSGIAPPPPWSGRWGPRLRGWGWGSWDPVFSLPYPHPSSVEVPDVTNTSYSFFRFDFYL